jgi:hypothetical protein
MPMNILVRALTGLVLLATATHSSASELDFSLQSRMPDVSGTLEREVRVVDATTGVHVTKRVFGEELPGLSIRTHVAEAGCAPAEVPGRRPYIVAVQHIARSPESFAAATLVDGFIEVYVADEAGRIRLYRNVPGYVMAELTERFRPVCPRI